METDPEISPQISQFPDEHSREDKHVPITDGNVMEQNNQDISEENRRNSLFETGENLNSSLAAQATNHGTSSPKDGAVDPMVDVRGVENVPKLSHGQEWPPLPILEVDIQPEAIDVIEIQDEVKESRGGMSVRDTEEGENVAQADTFLQLSKESTDEGQELESHGDSDSVVLLSENSEDLNVDGKSLDFSSNKDQWVRQESLCDEAQNVPNTKSSSDSFITESLLPSGINRDSGVSAEIVQQRELEVSVLHENKVGQQVCGDAPPLETVVDQPANPSQEDSAGVSREVKEPLILGERRRRPSESEERESSETGEERKQTEGEGKQLREVKDQTQELEHKLDTKPHPRERKTTRMEVDLFDDNQSDSGVSTDFSPSSTTEVSEGHVNADEPPLNETPIEKEIRLAIKREQSLRRSRGLSDTTDSTNVYVEIPLRKPILSQDLQTRATQTLEKDREFAGKKMQKEISAETDREKVLVELGRLPGFYDKGTEVHLQEKKMLFESFQEQKESMPALNRDSMSNSESAAGLQEIDSTVNVKQRLLQFSQNSPISSLSQFGASNGNLPEPMGPCLTEGITSQVIIIEANSFPLTASNGGYKTVSWTDGETMKPINSEGTRASSAPLSTNKERAVVEDTSSVKENPFFKLRPSATVHSQVELDIKEAKERERELQKQRMGLYGGATSDLQAARRTGVHPRTENRVKEETRSSGKEVFSPSPPPVNLTPPGSQTTTSVRQSTGKLDLTWPPSQAEDQTRQTTEKPLKNPRQRNTLLERWESGTVNGNVEDFK